MYIELGAPAVLPLGLVRMGPRLCLMGIALQHPPVHLFAQEHSQLVVTGARAHIGTEFAQQFLDTCSLPHQAELEIELAIPAFMGLGSDTTLGLSVARALAVLYQRPDDAYTLASTLDIPPAHALEVAGFANGGLLLVDVSMPQSDAAIVRRHRIAHTENEAWAFVLYFPRTSADTPQTLEADRLQMHLDVLPKMSTDTGQVIVDQIWPAVARDDIEGFGDGLHALCTFNAAALRATDAAGVVSDDRQAILECMRENGAIAWGQSLTGRCLYGLVKGAAASIEMRTALRKETGPFGGRVMATITDNAGARHVTRDGTLDDKKLEPPRTR